MQPSLVPEFDKICYTIRGKVSCKLRLYAK